MDVTPEQKGLEYLKEIEKDVEVIQKNTPTPKRAFVMGVMQGMGAVLGSILAVILLGWVLSVFGVIPGLKDVADYLQEVSSRIR